jgi:transposase
MRTVLMDSDRRSGQVERLEVVDTGRRRRWSEDEKLKIVLESLQAPRQVAATARRYGVSRSLLLRWRRLFRPESKDTPAQQIGFVPATVVADSGGTPGPVGPANSSGAIEIEFATGARMRITGVVDAATLKAAVAALADGRPE